MSKVQPSSFVTDQVIQTLESLLDDCSSTLSDAKNNAQVPEDFGSRQGSLLEQLQKVLDEAETTIEPIRIIHHFACTGGTLISKCLAVMPNTVLLSEVDPFSKMTASKSNFAPTDLIRLIRAVDPVSAGEVEGAIFLAGLRVAHQFYSRRGSRIVLREHTHSRYCMGDGVREGLTMSELVAQALPILSVITVRHPLDSFLSLLNNGWETYFTPSTIGEYARRYHAFLDAYPDVSIYRYEDFVKGPEEAVRQLCSELRLTFNAMALESFSAVKLTGDSGRSSGKIALRERRAVPSDLSEELTHSNDYQQLCARLGYAQ